METVNKMKRQPSEWRIYLQMKQMTKDYLQNIQAAYAAQYEKNKQPNQKMGRRPK